MLSLETLIGGEPSWDECEYLCQLRDAFGFLAQTDATPEYLAEANNMLVYEAEDFGVEKLRKAKSSLPVVALQALAEKNAIKMEKEITKRQYDDDI